MRLKREGDAPVLIVLGQSNAHGHGTHLTPDQEIHKPLKNVWGLPCTQNRAYGLTDVAWSGFVTYDMNLGETQNHTVCLAERFARRWQAAVDAGDPLPDLYVIQISVGAQGIAEQEAHGWNMWYPARPLSIRTDPGAIDISLYPLAVEILRLAMKNLREAGKRPVVIGLHWNQWETEAETGGESILRARENYEAFFAGLRQAVGQPFPLCLYRPLSEIYHNPQGVAHLCALFEEFARREDTVLIDLRSSPLYRKDREDKGIFQEDLVHYNPAAHQYFADFQWKLLFGGGREGIAPLSPTT